jgi:hypothetical protein
MRFGISGGRFGKPYFIREGSMDPGLIFGVVFIIFVALSIYAGYTTDKKHKSKLRDTFDFFRIRRGFKDISMETGETSEVNEKLQNILRTIYPQSSGLGAIKYCIKKEEDFGKIYVTLHHGLESSLGNFNILLSSVMTSQARIFIRPKLKGIGEKLVETVFSIIPNIKKYSLKSPVYRFDESFSLYLISTPGEEADRIISKGFQEILIRRLALFSKLSSNTSHNGILICGSSVFLNVSTTASLDVIDGFLSAIMEIGKEIRWRNEDEIQEL